MATSRSGAGGKMVTTRRRQRLAVTPYDRPPPPKTPNWFTGIIVPSARALASGAGKILSSIFSESESSSSEDEGFVSEDDIDDDNDYKVPYYGVNTLNKEHTASSEMMQYGEKSQLMWGRETKRIIEQLIMKETFSREESDKLIKILNSRVMDWSMEAGEKISVAGSPDRAVDNDVDKAIQEAKRWFQEKKVGPNSLTELAPEACDLTTALEQVETGGGSPVDVARSYMKERPPWASPRRNVEFKTPLIATTKLFKGGALCSVGHDSMSISKKRSSLASGSWNIQEELRRVRSRATEDMLRGPSSKADPSLFGVGQIRLESVGADEKVSATGERMTEPVDSLVDAGVGSDPALAAFESRQDGKASEALLTKPASVSGNNEMLETVMLDAECPPSKVIHPSSTNHAEEQHADPHLSEVNGSPAAEATEFERKECGNGPSSSQVSLSVENDDENPKADTIDENPVNIARAEGKCELLSEACMDVPIVAETDSIKSGSQNSQVEELSVDVGQPSPKGKVGIKAGKQQGRKPSKYNRKSRGRGQ